MQINDKTKKILDISLKVVTWLVVAFTVFMMVFTIFTVSTVDKTDRSIFGIKFYIVQTDSMSESENNKDMDIHFKAGDIVLIKNVKDKTVFKEGDVIAFVSTNSVSYLETVTHMIREVKKDDAGKVIGYVTYGTNTGVNDEALVEPEYVLGQYTGKLPGVGNFFAFVKSTPGYIICILVPFLLLILYNGVNVIRLFRNYRKEQTAQMEAEKAEIEAERQQNAEMFKELLALKEQLAKQQGGAAPSVEPVPQETVETAEVFEDMAKTETPETQPAAEETETNVAVEETTQAEETPETQPAAEETETNVAVEETTQAEETPEKTEGPSDTELKS